VEGTVVFVLLPTYCAPLSEVERHSDAHRAWVAAHIASGRFLMAGRREPREGGFILAADGDRAEYERIAAGDPFVAEGLAEYEVLEVHPTVGSPGFLGALADHGILVHRPS
jgi:uncharacterized protein YciI